jgi:hypothetical protein
MGKAPRYEMAVGLNKGHKTTKIVWGKNKQTADKKYKIRRSRLRGVRIKMGLAKGRGLIVFKPLPWEENIQ